MQMTKTTESLRMIESSGGAQEQIVRRVRAEVEVTVSCDCEERRTNELRDHANCYLYAERDSLRVAAVTPAKDSSGACVVRYELLRIPFALNQRAFDHRIRKPHACSAESRMICRKSST